MAHVGGDAVVAEEDSTIEARLTTDIEIEYPRTHPQAADEFAEGFAGITQLQMTGPVTSEYLGSDSPQSVVAQRGDEGFGLTVRRLADAQEFTAVIVILLPIIGGCQIHEHPHAIFTRLVRKDAIRNHCTHADLAVFQQPECWVHKRSSMSNSQDNRNSWRAADDRQRLRKLLTNLHRSCE